MTPTRLALEVARSAAAPASAITAASGRSTIGETSSRSSPRSSAIARSLMSRIAKSARPASQQLRRVGRRGGLAHVQRDALVGERAVGLRLVDAGVDGVRLEVEHEGRLLRGARFRTVVAAGREAGDGYDGRQQRTTLSIRSGRIALPTVADHGLDDELLAHIEIPKGSRNKYEYDEGIGEIVLDRFLSSSTVYPTDYGYLIGHRGQDGDPLDVLVCVSEPTFPGCVIAVKPIALFKMTDEKGHRRQDHLRPAHRPGLEQARGHRRSRRAVPPRGRAFLLGLQAARQQARRNRRLVSARRRARGDRRRRSAVTPITPSHSAPGP